MPSPRPMRSGIDYQLRYGVWRLVRIATGEDPSCAGARLLRIEWPLGDGDGGEIWSDFVIEGADGEVLEVVECREHLNAIPIDSLQKFLASVARIRAGKQTNGATRFRYVSPAWFLEDGRNLKDPQMRNAVIASLDASFAELADSILWDLQAETKSAFTAGACLAMHQRVVDIKSMYERLYARLAAQLGDRLPGADPACREAFRDTQVELFPRDPQRHTGRLAEPEDAFDVLDLQRRLGASREPLGGLEEDVRRALREGLFSDDGVTTEDVFVDLDARVDITDIKGAPVQHQTTVMRGLVDWLTDVRDFRELPVPLIVVGAFGAGKSTALRVFAARLLDNRREIVPIFIPLRDLASAPDPKRFDEEIERYVRRKWNFSIEEVSRTTPVCLLCDGFDELNLYYSSSADSKWAQQVYSRLEALAQSSRMAVAVSSRPLQLLDTEAQMSARGDRAPRLTIQDLTEPQIDQWCELYGKKAGFSGEFSLRFLEERNLSAVARTPIILYMIARIYATSPELLPKEQYTRGAIYRRFVDWTVSGGYTSEKQKHLVPPSHFRDVLKDIAWQLAQAEGGMMREAELLLRLQETHGSTIEDVPVGRNLLVAHMLRPVLREEASTTETDHLIEFTHQSFRDYLAAERVIRELEANRVANLAGHPVTAATVEFLFDWIDGMPEEEKRGFFRRTAEWDDLEKVMPQVAERLLDAASGATLAAAEARRMLVALPVVAMTVASLVLMMRNRAAAGLRDDEQRAGVKQVAYAINAADLRKIVAVLNSFASDADVPPANELLVRHLDGLSFPPRSALDAMKVSLPSLRNAACYELFAAGLDLTLGDARDCAFNEVDFQRAHVTIAAGSDIGFEGCDFRFAELSFGDEDGMAQIRVTRSSLGNCRIPRLFVKGGHFEKNGWDGASVEQGFLSDCSLDEAALEFFRRSRVRMVNCQLSRQPGRWRTTAAWSQLFERLRDTDPARFSGEAEPFVRIAIPELGYAMLPAGHLWCVQIGSAERRVLVRESVSGRGVETTPDLPSDADRLVIVVPSQSEAADALTMAEDLVGREVREANVWTSAELVEEAFVRVAAAAEKWLTVGAVPAKEAERSWSYVRVSRAVHLSAAGESNVSSALALAGTDPLEEFDRERRARVVVVTGAPQSGKTMLCRRLLDYAAGQWAMVAGRSVRPDEQSLGALLLAAVHQIVPYEETIRPLFLEILATVTADMAADPSFGFIIDDLDQAPDSLASLRLFRNTRASVVITLRREAWDDLQTKIEMELAMWPQEQGLAQEYLLLDLSPA